MVIFDTPNEAFFSTDTLRIDWPFTTLTGRGSFVVAYLNPIRIEHVTL